MSDRPCLGVFEASAVAAKGGSGASIAGPQPRKPAVRRRAVPLRVSSTEDEEWSE
ncbi:MAG: hypothetical protein JWL84_6314 [Rhodospirillales bacterium]|jgi:hypothetical protein|nr:hypothetical protein [Rhodospirillales bacterium]